MGSVTSHTEYAAVDRTIAYQYTATYNIIGQVLTDTTFCCPDFLVTRCKHLARNRLDGTAGASSTTYSYTDATTGLYLNGAVGSQTGTYTTSGGKLVGTSCTLRPPSGIARESAGGWSLTVKQEAEDIIPRLSRLLGFLDSDPDNLALLADAANAALDETALDQVTELVVRYRSLAEVPPALLNVEGIAAMRQGRLDEAAAIFEALRDAGHEHPALRFNLAWVGALQKRHKDVLVLLDDNVVSTVPRAAALKIQSLHRLGRIDEAIATGQKLAEQFPNDQYLLGALSIAALDGDNLELARISAGQASGGADALTTQGLLSLNDEALEAAIRLFDRAIAEHPEAPRAWLGRGLSLLAQGYADAAAPCIDKGAELFGEHLGSWIASGWTHFMRKDLAKARRSFAIALSHDDNFAETHGGLAVLDVAEGNIESARKRTDVALRLDKECFGGILARTLLLEMDGKPELAEKIRNRTMDLPIGLDGKTLAQAMIGLGMGVTR